MCLKNNATWFFYLFSFFSLSFYPFYICLLPSVIHWHFYVLLFFFLTFNLNSFQISYRSLFPSLLLFLVFLHSFCLSPHHPLSLHSSIFLQLSFIFHSSILHFLPLLSSISYPSILPLVHFPPVSIQPCISRFSVLLFFHRRIIPVFHPFILQFSIFPDFHQPLLTFGHES